MFEKVLFNWTEQWMKRIKEKNSSKTIKQNANKLLKKN
jgi:hypothetical protein